MGPFSIGRVFRMLSVVCVLGVCVLFFIGVQPPNDKALAITMVSIALLFAVWFLVERKRFQGPPTGDLIKLRQADIARAEQALEGAD
jgi:cobalamin synthase